MIELWPPQHYPNCAQLTVTGDGDDFPEDDYLVSFPGAYSNDGKSGHSFLQRCESNLLGTDPGLAIAGQVYGPIGHSTYVSLLCIRNQLADQF